LPVKLEHQNNYPPGREGFLAITVHVSGPDGRQLTADTTIPLHPPAMTVVVDVKECGGEGAGVVGWGVRKK